MTPDPAPPPVLPAEWVTPRPAQPLEVLQRILTLPALMRENFDLIRTTLRRDISARFQGTLLGWAWPFLQPLFLFAIYYFIFTQLLQVKMPNLPDDKKAAMGVYMFVGMIPWTMVAESLARGTGVIVDNGNLIKKLAFPSELLPLNVVLASMVMMLFAVAIFVLAAVATPVWQAPGLGLLWIPALVLMQAFFAYGLVLLTATLHVFLRDTAQVVTMITTVWMFVTPIFWVPELVGAEAYQTLLDLNPVYHLIAAWRGALVGDISMTVGERLIVPVSTAATAGHFAWFALAALGTYAFGYTFFVLSQRRFADEV